MLVTAGALADISNVLTTRMHVPLLAATVATICITVQTTPPASVPNVVPIPHKRAMGMPAAPLAVNAATTTPAVNLASSAAMTLSGDAALMDLHASQILTNVPLEAQVAEVLEVEAVEVLRAEAVELASQLLLLPSQLCCQEPLLPAVV